MGLVFGVPAEEGLPGEVDVGEAAVAEAGGGLGALGEGVGAGGEGLGGEGLVGFVLGEGEDGEDLAEEEEGDEDGGGDGEGPGAAFLFLPEVKEHDDEEEEDHDGSGVDEDLDDADEVGVEAGEEAGEADEGEDHGEGAGDRVREKGESQGAPGGEEGEEVEEDAGHGRRVRNPGPRVKKRVLGMWGAGRLGSGRYETLLELDPWNLKLQAPPVPPDLAALRALGVPVVFAGECASTNDLALKKARDGAGHGTTVVAGRQTAGRGRRGSAWHAGEGSLAFSVVLRPDGAPSGWSRLGLAAAHAVVLALEAEGLAPRLKWPNDLWLSGKKCCGILIENTGEAAVAGVGINVNGTEFPGGLEATSLRLEGGREFGRGKILAAAVENLLRFCGEEAFPEVVAALRSRCALTGKRVALVSGGRELSGVVTGLADSGALLLDGREIHQAEKIRPCPGREGEEEVVLEGGVEPPRP